jgi:hypothetical protein
MYGRLASWEKRRLAGMLQLVNQQMLQQSIVCLHCMFPLLRPAFAAGVCAVLA